MELGDGTTNLEGVVTLISDMLSVLEAASIRTGIPSKTCCEAVRQLYADDLRSYLLREGARWN